jgi:hypothetical protein
MAWHVMRYVKGETLSEACDNWETELVDKRSFRGEPPEIRFPIVDIDPVKDRDVRPLAAKIFQKLEIAQKRRGIWLLGRESVETQLRNNPSVERNYQALLSSAFIQEHRNGSAHLVLKFDGEFSKAVLRDRQRIGQAIDSISTRNGIDTRTPWSTQFQPDLTAVYFPKATNHDDAVELLQCREAAMDISMSLVNEVVTMGRPMLVGKLDLRGA